MNNQREIATAKVEFRIHLFVYLAVNTLLLVIDLTTSPEYLWFYWPLGGWGIGLVIQAIRTYGWAGGPGLKERMIEREMEK